MQRSQWKHPASVKIKATHKETKQVLTFESINAFAKYCNASQGNVSSAMNKPNRSVAGYRIESVYAGRED